MAAWCRGVRPCSSLSLLASWLQTLFSHLNSWQSWSKMYFDNQTLKMTKRLKYLFQSAFVMHGAVCIFYLNPWSFAHLANSRWFGWSDPVALTSSLFSSATRLETQCPFGPLTPFTIRKGPWLQLKVYVVCVGDISIAKKITLPLSHIKQSDFFYDFDAVPAKYVFN